jgi:hypothetical protein
MNRDDGVSGRFATSDAMLDELAKVGRPRLYRTEKGTWGASLDLPAPDGITAKVASDFDHPTHRDALACVMRRLDDMRGMLEVGGEKVSRSLRAVE